MELSLQMKASAFCRELDDDSFRIMARDENMEDVFRRAETSLKAGRIEPELETDLDSLDAMVKRVEGQGLYRPASRHYDPLPISSDSTGAQWWACPGNRCAGRGRVLPGQEVPTCSATGERLVARPMRE